MAFRITSAPGREPEVTRYAVIGDSEGDCARGVAESLAQVSRTGGFATFDEARLMMDGRQWLSIGMAVFFATGEANVQTR